jgi:hypothetical protein
MRKKLSISANLAKRKADKKAGVKRARRRDLINLVGEVYGRLTVISLMPIDYSGTYVAHWKCRCSCGKITVARSDRLKNGQKQSCGCLNNEGRVSRVGQMNQTRKYFLGPKKVLPEMTREQRLLYKKLRYAFKVSRV